MKKRIELIKLARKKENKKKRRDRPERKLLNAAIGTTVVGLSARPGHFLSRKALQSFHEHDGSKDVEGLSDLLDKLKSDGTARYERLDGGHIEGPLLANKGKPIAVLRHKDMPFAAYAPASADQVQRGAILLGEGDGKGIFLHELGHATGIGGKKNYLRTIDRLAKASNKSRRGRVLGSMLLGAYAGNVDDDSPVSQRIADANLLLNAGIEAPVLFEEARASIRANMLARKFGTSVDNKQLAKAYATYGAPALVALAPALVARHIMKKRNNIARRMREKQEKKAQLYVLSPEILGNQYLEKQAMPNINAAKGFLQGIANKVTNIAKDPSQLAALGSKLQYTGAQMGAQASSLMKNPALQSAMAGGSLSQLGMGLGIQGGLNLAGKMAPSLGNSSMFGMGKTLLGGLA